MGWDTSSGYVFAKECESSLTHFHLRRWWVGGYKYTTQYRITGFNLKRKNYSRQVFREELSKFDCALPPPLQRTTPRGHPVSNNTQIFYLKYNYLGSFFRKYSS